jgi:hypothetical protein
VDARDGRLQRYDRRDAVRRLPDARVLLLPAMADKKRPEPQAESHTEPQSHTEPASRAESH